MKQDVVVVSWNNRILGGADKVAYMVAAFLPKDKYNVRVVPYRDIPKLTLHSSTIVHNHAFSASLPKILQNTRSVSTLHALPDRISDMAKQAATARSSKAVATENSWMANNIRDIYGVKCHIIYNGSPMNLFPPTNATKEGDFVIGYHGRIHESKGIPQLISAVRFLRDNTGLDIRLKLLGWSYINIPNEPWINLTPPTEDDRKVAAWLDTIDLEVLPTKADQQPMTAIEALLRGVPVMITGLPQLREFNGLVEWLPRNITYTQLALEIYKKMDTFTDTYRNRIQRKAVERFSIAKMINSYIRLYNSI